MTSFLLLLIFGYVVAFFYTLSASIKNSRRILGLERDVAELRAQLAAGAGAVPVAAQPAGTETVAEAGNGPIAAAPERPAETTIPETETAPVAGANDSVTPAPVRVAEGTENAAQDDAETAIAARAAAPAEIARQDETTFAPVFTSAATTKESFESMLGARWAVWAGGLALALGGIFLVKYSIESGLLSPAVRLALAALFGLLLAAAGEAIRRKALPRIEAAYSNAMIPGILTAAGALTLFGVVYAAYAIYAYIGPTTAFVALALVALATLGLSLLHGQALAGLGLFGSMVTPALISSEAPSLWTLFIFLTVSWMATTLAAARQRWHVVPALANLGMGGWAMASVALVDPVDAQAVLFGLLSMIAGAIWIWPGKAYEAPIGVAIKATPHARRFPALAELLNRPPSNLSATLALGIAGPAILFALTRNGISLPPAFAVAVLVLSLAALGAFRRFAVWPAVMSALTAVFGAQLLADHVLTSELLVGGTTPYSAFVANDHVTSPVLRMTGIVFLFIGLLAVRKKSPSDPRFATLWAVLVALVPLHLGLVSFVEFGNLSRDWLHALYGMALGCSLAGFAYRFEKRDDLGSNWPVNIMVVGSFFAFTFTIMTLTSGLATTLLVPALGFLYAMASKRPQWRSLPWIMVLSLLFVMARIAWEPTLVGPQNLGRTPFFNALLPGYGLPTLLAIVAAWRLRDWPGLRVKHLLQAIASLMGLLTLAILVRHAMNGGVLSDAVPTLGEQSIYTLLTIGMSGVLMTLDLKSPSPIFRIGSMVAGVLAMANVAIAHFYVLNPYFSGESTGPWPFFNLLLIGYLLPGIAYAGLAHYARGRRPAAYVTLLALAGAALGFAWATLSVRRFWQGENIADWKGFLQGETYSYSVVWLVIGVLLLVAGSRFAARSLRLASAALVLLAVAKAFLIDMSNLEGVLRALSFIGLGVVLIGIGLFYQKILTTTPKAPEPQPAESP